jgi:hypothetical protein
MAEPFDLFGVETDFVALVGRDPPIAVLLGLGAAAFRGSVRAVNVLAVGPPI